MGYYFHIHLDFSLNTYKHLLTPPDIERLTETERLLKYLCSGEARTRKHLPHHAFFHVENWRKLFWGGVVRHYQGGVFSATGDIRAREALETLPLFLDWIAPFILVAESYRFLGYALAEQSFTPTLYFADEQQKIVATKSIGIRDVSHA